jgi:hypothetical protein
VRAAHDFVATAVVRWLSADQGGRSSGPPTADVYAATTVFVLGGERETMPGWPATADQLSILIRPTSRSDDRVDVADIGFLAPDLARPHLRVGAQCW